MNAKVVAVVIISAIALVVIGCIASHEIKTAAPKFHISGNEETLVLLEITCDDPKFVVIAGQGAENVTITGEMRVVNDIHHLEIDSNTGEYGAAVNRMEIRKNGMHLISTEYVGGKNSLQLGTISGGDKKIKVSYNSPSFEGDYWDYWKEDRYGTVKIEIS